MPPKINGVEQPAINFDASFVPLFGRPAKKPVPATKWTGPKYTVEKIIDEIYRRVGDRFCSCSITDCVNVNAQLCTRKEFGYMLRIAEFRDTARKLARHEGIDNE